MLSQPIRPRPRDFNHINHSISDQSWGQKVKSQQKATDGGNLNILLGASYFERLSRPEHRHIYNDYFDGWRNHGIGGDRVEHIAWRIKNGCIPTNTTKVILSAGTNNIGKNDPMHIAISIIQCVLDIKKLAPNAEILVIGILPRAVRDLDDHEGGEHIRWINSFLKQKLSNVCQYHEPNCHLWKKHSFNPSFYKHDNVHLNNGGYTKLFNDLITFIHSNKQPINYNYIDDVIGRHENITPLPTPTPSSLHSPTSLPSFRP